jgi:putative tryptophan/tyrosine transport system substrate-binding protein
MVDLKRRQFITLLGGAAAAWPLAARAQQAMPVIGLISAASPDADKFRIDALRRGLNYVGLTEGQSFVFEYVWVGGQYDRFPALLADLVRRRVNVVVSLGGTPGALAAKAATKTIPIVFQVGIDPVAAGLVDSLSRPGGNVTGVSQLLTATAPKQLQLLHEVVPSASSIAVLLNPTNAIYSDLLRDLQSAARTLGPQLHFVHASTQAELDTVFGTLADLRVQALLIGPDLYFLSTRDQLIALAARQSLPAIYPWREGAISGGLMSYGSSQTDTYRQVGIYAGRILKGDKPADLPVQQSTKIELILNLKTARALGIDFPLAVLGRADEVIE